MGIAADKTATSQKLGPFVRDFERFVEIRGLTEAPMRVRVRTGLLSPELRSVACFRFGQRSESLYRRKKVLGFVPYVVGKLWHRRQVAANHVHISPEAQVGAGLAIMHNYSVLIGAATIGTNCVLHHNVTIGEGVAGNSHAIPTLGNSVWIGPGVTIAGEVSIGDNVTISAGTVLTRSVPSGALVAGNPGRVVQLEYNLVGRDLVVGSDEVN
jgi:serine O-acetyltransferase